MGDRWVRICAAPLVLTLACAEPDRTSEAEAAPEGLYVAAVSGLDDAPFPTTLSVHQLVDGRAPRVETVLEAQDSGWVLPLPDARAPSGRYALYSYVYRIDGDGLHPWLAGLHLLDLEHAPMGPTRYLGVPGSHGFAGWSEDEDFMWIVVDDGPSSLWTLPLGDDEPRPLSRIPIDVDYPSIQGCRLAPGGAWLTFVPDSRRLFAARFEQRTPVEVVALEQPDEDVYMETPQWLDARGRGLGMAWQGSLMIGRLVAFDLSVEPRAWFVEVEGEPAVATNPGDPETQRWRVYEDADAQLWALRERDLGDTRALAWVPLDWSGDELVAGTPVDVDLDFWPNVAPERVGEHVYVRGASPVGSDDAGVFVLGLGETAPERIWGVEPWLPYTRVDDRGSLLALHGDQGVVVFELDARGHPGVAQLASATDWLSWGVYDTRFVQALLSPFGLGVRVADYGGGEPTIWDLPAVEAWTAVPSPVDSRVLFVDEGKLWVDDPRGEHAREQLALPNEPEQILIDVSTGEPVANVIVSDVLVHAPGVGSYAMQ